MKNKALPACSLSCMNQNRNCENSGCRYWISYKKEHNCSMISIYLHGRMTLKQVSERLDVSIARIKQIETKALEKVKAVLKNNINALGISE